MCPLSGVRSIGNSLFSYSHAQNQIISDTCSEAWSSRTANNSRRPELPLPSFGVSERRHHVFGRRPVPLPPPVPPPVLRPCWSDPSPRCPPELSAAAGGVVSEQSRRHSSTRRQSERRRGNADLFRRTGRRYPVSNAVRALQRSWRPERKRKPLRSRRGSDVKEEKEKITAHSVIISQQNWHELRFYAALQKGHREDLADLSDQYALCVRYM